MISTPAYSGVIYTDYLNSIIRLLNNPTKDVSFDVLTINNESLISRARNKLANICLNIKGVDKVFFIDGDIGFTREEFLSLVTSDKKVIGGSTPLKGFSATGEFVLNFVHPDFPNRSPNDLAAMELYYNSPVVPVKYLGNAFLSIDISVFRELADKCNSYTAPNGQVYYEFFRTGVFDGEDLSEDYYFCKLCKDNGIQPYLHTKVLTSHTGTHRWNPK